MAVWTLILQSEPEGPALISCAARLLRSDSTFANLLLAPSWRTDLGHLEGDITAVANYLRADLDELLFQGCQRPVFRSARVSPVFVGNYRDCKRAREAEDEPRWQRTTDMTAVSMPRLL